MAGSMSDDIKLNYEISKYSSFSTTYLPENIRENCPSNQSSRWSSNTNNPPQYLILKLNRPSIVRKILFGKYEKTHVCNVRKFKVFGGMEDNNMVQLFEGGLRNDSIPEIFDLKHTTESGKLLPVIYIQIMPLLSWGPSFNFSIWYVELHGQDDPIYVQSSLREYNKLREVEIIRLCLKHFRQQGYEEAFLALQKQTQVHLEDPMMTNLHKALVVDGDFENTEKFIDKCVHDGLMDNYLAQQNYRATWTLQESSNEIEPGVRGGHQLIIDSVNRLILLFGGWNGSEDMNDLWCYNIKTNRWTLIHEHADNFDGPSPRSCHKMVYDTSHHQIFILGRYLDYSSRTVENIKSDFYLYNTITKTWLLICDDTTHVGGPQLIFDHQMCIDVSKRTIYVFGGRILTPRNIEDLSNYPQYSGLFSYHIDTNTWTQLLVDCGHPTAANPDVLSIKSRVTHSMLFDHRRRKLYIFGGQRNKEYTTEFLSYEVDTNELSIDNMDHTTDEGKNVPQSGFTQRATIDCERDEIYVLSSLSKEKERRGINLNAFWVYSMKKRKWTSIYKSDHSNCYVKSHIHACPEPCPRYAHQMVYDWVGKVHYLFGGNPGKNTLPNLRLDDFWVLHLEKPSRSEILRQCIFNIRKLHYEEISRQNALKAVQYLQTKIYEIIDHNDSIQLEQFHKLASLLFKCDVNADVGMDVVDDDSKENENSSNSSLNSYPYPSSSMDESTGSKEDDIPNRIKNQRCLLYNKIVELLPSHMVHPKGNLSDFVVL